MAYQPLSSLPSLFNQTSTQKNIPLAPVTQPTQAQSAASLTAPTTTSGGFIYDSLGRKIGHTTPTPSVGVKTQSPTDNLKAPTNTTTQPKVTAPIQTTKSTDNGTQATGMNTAQQYATQSVTAPSNTQPTFDQSNQGLYGQIIAALANRSNQSGKDYQDAQAEAQRIADQQTALAKEYAQKTKNIEGTAGFLTQATGLEGQLANQYNLNKDALAQQYAGATNRLTAANTQQGLLQQALQSAGSLAAPQLASYSQQAFNPVTGQFGGGASLDQAVSDVAQKLKTGQMTYNDALNALSGYGQGGVNALQKALPAGFNISQSNTLGAQQGSVKPAYDFAKKALTNLQETVKNLGVLQGTNIPGYNAIGDWISRTTGYNSDATRQYTQAIQEARAAYSQLLAAGGATPSASDSRAAAAIPDNATPNDIQAAINSLETLGQSKVDIYGNPGISGSNNSSSGSSITTPSGLTINPNF